MLIAAGVVLIVLSVLLVLGERLPFKLGRLPGDIVIERKGGSFYFPIATCLLASALLTLASWVVNRFR